MSKGGSRQRGIGPRRSMRWRQVGTAGSVAVARRESLSFPVPERLALLALPGALATWANPLSLSLALAGVVVWFASLKGVDLGEMNDLGLASVLPGTAYLALAFLAGGFAVGLWREKPSTGLMLAHVGALVFVLYGLTAMVETVPRFGPAWRHVGVTEYLARSGVVDPLIDAYFNWPGFFALSALFAQAGGLEGVPTVLLWMPLAFAALYLGPLLMIMRSATSSARHAWLAVWVFYLANWVGQDYFAPQALNFFFYLVVLAVVLTWFKVGAKESLAGWIWRRLPVPPSVARFVGWLGRPTDVTGAELGRGQRVGVTAILVIVLLTIVASHQLTPFALLLGLTVLTLFGRSNLRALPVILVAFIGFWLLYPADAYISGHLEKLMANVGKVTSLVEANVGSRVQGSPDHVLIVRLRMLFTVAITLLAGFGAIRRWRAGRRDLAMALLSAAPFVLLLLQVYGGEMLLRAYLFSLPFLAFFVAAAIHPPRGRVAWPSLAAIALVGFALSSAFLFARYGNERMEYFTPAEVEAVDYLYDRADPGTLIFALSSSFPHKYREYEEHRVRLLTGQAVKGDVDAMVLAMRDPKAPGSYLVITRSQKANLQMYYGLSDESLVNLENRLVANEKLRLTFANEGAKVFALAQPAGDGGSVR